MVANQVYPVAISSGCSAVIRLQPFNTEAFGFISAQLTDVVFEHLDDVGTLLATANSVAYDVGVHHMVTRVSASDMKLKAALQQNGFYYAETSIMLSLSGLKDRDYSKLAGRVELVQPGEGDILELARIAGEDFHHGRFLEDPFLDVEFARRRHRLWMYELAKTGELYAARVRGRLIGFHAEHVSSSGEADLILTGASHQYAMLAPAIWASALMSLKTRGVARCSTLVSAANLGVLNLYKTLDFRFDRALCGFHRFYR